MFASLRALLNGIIDYAGLFPPAALPLDQAIKNYARYRKDADAWMLSRFICPATQLADAGPFIEAFFDERTPFHCSVLGKGGNEIVPFQAATSADLAAVAECRRVHGHRVTADVFEVRLPADHLLLTSLAAVSLQHEMRMQGYFEGTLAADWRSWTRATLGALLLRAETRIGHQLPASPVLTRGYKLRCGGLNASAFPSIDQVAYTIAACRDAKVPMKFTAGLHHPIRHFNAGVQTHMHGFINVFAAGVLAHARGLSEEQLRDVIADEDAAHFAFDDAGLCWRDHRAATAEITAARQEFVTSFGSCSFDEPRDDLRALGWM